MGLHHHAVGHQRLNERIRWVGVGQPSSGVALGVVFLSCYSMAMRKEMQGWGIGLL